MIIGNYVGVRPAGSVSSPAVTPPATGFTLFDGTQWETFDGGVVDPIE